MSGSSRRLGMSCWGGVLRGSRHVGLVKRKGEMEAEDGVFADHLYELFNF